MYRLLLRFLIAVLMTGFIFICRGQTKLQYTCGDEQLRSLLRQVEPAYDRMQTRNNLQLRDYINQTQKNKLKPVFQKRPTADSTFVIPVVVHIIYPEGEAYGTGTNISYAQIRSQIEALNAAFSKDYPAYNGQSHPSYAIDTRIRFCLARNTSDTATWATGPGGMEFGVKRYPNNSGAFNHNISLSSANELLSITHPSVNSFPFDKYLNIWLVNSIGGGDNIMGYAPRPIMPGYTLDGIVMRADVFGDNTTGGGYELGFSLGQGKVLAHEVGHYLNLYHIFQEGCAGANAAGSATDACDLNGDMICDIKPSNTQNIFCTGNVPNTCTANYATGTTDNDMINDYMSYADDDCMNTFTLDQAQRMWATLNLQRPALWQPQNLAATGVLGTGGCVPPFLNAHINTDNAVFCAGSPIVFSNPAAGNTATTYQWQFEGGIPSLSTKNSDTVNYLQPGNYKAILKVSDGTNVSIDSLSITVLKCQLDSSMLYMAHWYFGNFGSVDFSSGTPVETKVALTHQSIQGESSYPSQPPYIGATVSLSDSLGNLLFYSNGVSVWNKNHKKITTTPMFGKSDINASSGICYIPYPGHKGKYFVAGVYPNFDESPSGVRYVLVDVDSNAVNPFMEFNHPSLPKRVSQFLTVVPHCNGTDYWIITKGYGLDNTKFYSFLVTATGIDPSQEPVISSGFLHPGFGGSGDQLKANRQGNKLILSSPHGYLNIEAGALYDFDSRTGLVSNEQKIADVNGYSNIQTGAAFSPNGEYFYLMRSSNFATNGPPYWLFQYRVSDLQYNIFNAPGFYFAASFQPGPDNQIYVTTQDNFFARISNPDVWGKVSVNGSFINMMQLDNNIRTGVSMPAFIDARQPTPAHPDFSVSALNCNTFRFTSLCFDKYTANWNFGDGSPVQTGNVIDHNFVTSGTFNVTLSLSSGSVTYGSVSKKANVLPLTANITGPNFVCTNNNYPSQYFSPVLTDVNYKWTVSNGSLSGPDNLPFADVTWSQSNNRGNIQLRITRENCSVSASKVVNISTGPSISWMLPDSICVFDSSFALVASPAGGSFAGPGVNNNVFSPAIAGIGNHTITYTYLSDAICGGHFEKIIKVRRCEIPIDQNTDCQDILKSVQISFNPVNNILKLKSEHVLKFVQIYNEIGQKVAQGQLIDNNIHLPMLASGIYTVLIYCEKNMSNKAFRFLKF